jgi:hypothetical protein
MKKKLILTKTMVNRSEKKNAVWFGCRLKGSSVQFGYRTSFRNKILY